jgi:hypothetical protein
MKKREKWKTSGGVSAKKHLAPPIPMRAIPAIAVTIGFLVTDMPKFIKTDL